MDSMQSGNIDSMPTPKMDSLQSAKISSIQSSLRSRSEAQTDEKSVQSKVQVLQVGKGGGGGLTTEGPGGKMTTEVFENITNEPSLEPTEAADTKMPNRMMNPYIFSKPRFRKRSDHIFIALSLIASLSNIFRFPAILSESGGILFFIPYMLCLFLITLPVIYLENALGQYCSLPPLLLFHRLSPAFGGIGFALTFIAVTKSVILSYTAFDLFYALKSLSAAFSTASRAFWLECVYEGHPSCYDPHIKCDEANGFYQYYSKCIKFALDKTVRNPNYTWEQVVIGVTTTSEALRELPTQIYLLEKIREPGRPSPYLIASAVIEQAIIAVIAMLGMRVYAKLARFIVIFPQLCLLGCMIYAFEQLGVRDALNAIGEGLKPDATKLMTARAWGGALLHAVIAMNLLDGSYVTLAAMKTFRNNFMRDTFIVIIYGMLTNVFSCLVIFSVSGVATKIIFPLQGSKGLVWLWKYGRFTPYIILPLVFAKTPHGAILLSLCYFSMFLFGIAAQLLALEMIITTACCAVPRAKYVDVLTARKIIVCVYFLFMFLYSYVEANNNKISGLYYFYFAFAQALIGLFEIIISIHLYRLKRFIANIQTMLGKPPNKFWSYMGYPVNWYFTICWYAATPLCFLILSAFSLFAAIKTNFFKSEGLIVYVTTFGPLIILVLIFVYRLVRASRRRKAIRLLFHPSMLWGPELARNRQQALYEERAMRAFT